MSKDEEGRKRRRGRIRAREAASASGYGIAYGVKDTTDGVGGVRIARGGGCRRGSVLRVAVGGGQTHKNGSVPVGFLDLDRG